MVVHFRLTMNNPTNMTFRTIHRMAPLQRPRLEVFGLTFIGEEVVVRDTSPDRSDEVRSRCFVDTESLCL
jgi:hypothetical protein